MEHDEIRLKLAAYLDNAVSDEEKEEIRRHLAMCGSCRGEIAELELTVRYLKTLPEVDPPSWLADKIMAKVRDEGRQKSTLWKRLFSPLYIKLPIEAFALLFICVTGFYISRMVNEKAPITAKPTITPKLTEERPPAHVKPEVRSVPALPKAKNDIRRPVMDYPLEKKEESKAPPPAPPKPQESASTEETPPQSRKMVEPELRSTGNGFFSDRETRSAVREEKGTGVLKSVQKEKSLERGEDSVGAVSRPSGNMEITLVVDEPKTASERIEDTVTDMGGRINGHSYSGETNILFIRIGADRVDKLVERLGLIGRVKERPRFSPEAVGMIDMIIRW
jgi:hypothetical protein